MLALKHFYRELGDKTWGWMGFYDAFNQTRNWYTDSYLAIDQGPIILMIENHRSRLLWDLFMSNPEIQPMLDAIGFYSDPNRVEEIPLHHSLTVFPNPARGDIQLSFSTEDHTTVQVDLYSVSGQRQQIMNQAILPPGKHSLRIQKKDLVPGIYMVRIIFDGNEISTAKLIVH
jgi:hypothetical protein